MNIFRDCATTTLLVRFGVFHHTTHQTWTCDTTPKTKTACCPWDMVLGPPKRPFFLWLRVITEWNPNAWWDDDPNNPRILFCFTAAWMVDFSSSFLAKASLTVGKFNTWKLLWTWISNKLVPRKEYITPTTVLFLGDYLRFKPGVCICCSVSTIRKLQTIQSGSWCHLAPSSAKWPMVFMKKWTLKRLQFW